MAKDKLCQAHVRCMRSTGQAKCKVIAMSIQNSLFSKDLSQTKSHRQSVVTRSLLQHLLRELRSSDAPLGCR